MVNSTLPPLNGTHQHPAEWSFTAIVKVTICPVQFTLNGLVMLIFIQKRLFSNQFQIYLFNLLLANFMYSFFNYPLDIVGQIYRPYWYLGDVGCTVYQYSTHIIGGVMINSHTLITFSRIWAVTFPISYTQNKSSKTAVKISCVVWLYMHVFFLPYVVLHAVYYRLPIETFGCLGNMQRSLTGYGAVYQVVVSFLPCLFITTGYVYLLYMRKRLRIIPGNAGHGDSGNSAVSGRRDKKQGFIVLTILTVSVSVLYTPASAIFTVARFMPLNHPIMLNVLFLLIALQPVLDPVYFVLALPELRDFVGEWFRKH